MPRILIVEDDADSRLALSLRLRASGFEVAVAADAAGATSQARQQQPDLVILDLGLPAGDGFVVMERLRGIAPTRDVPIIVLTGRDPEAHEERARAAGAVAFFQKPADNAALIDAIRAHLPVERSLATPPAKLLVVEDDADTRQAMMVRLRHEGFEVASAADATSAVAAALREKPDVILLDLGLPGGGGTAVLDRLRRNTALAATPVIVVTARADAAAREDALGAGARAVLTKPVDPPTLVSEIRGLLLQP
jgi:DNA-binding response OmpR family regulator